MSLSNPRLSMIALALLVAIAAASGAALAQSKPSIAAAPRSAPMPQAAAPVATPSAADTALEAVGAGDIVKVTVFRNPDLTTDARVTDQGTIFFPLIGEVEVAGLTPQQVGKRIGTGLGGRAGGRGDVRGDRCDGCCGPVGDGPVLR